MARKLPKGKAPESAWFGTPAFCNCGARVKVAVDDTRAHTFRCDNGHEAAVGKEFAAGKVFALASRDEVRAVEVAKRERHIELLQAAVEEARSEYWEAELELELAQARLEEARGES